MHTRIILSIIFLIISGLEAKAQFYQNSIRYSISLEQYVTASGHGTATEINFCLCEESHHLETGLFGNPRQTAITGTSINYRYKFTERNEALQLSLFSKFIYRWQAHLKERLETRIYPEGASINTFRTFEAYSGLSLHYPLFERILIGTNVGMGFYHRCLQEKTDYRKPNFPRFSPDYGISLLLSVEANFRL